MSFYILCLLLLTLLIFIIFKLIVKFTTGINKNYTCLTSKTIIITGANTGIGFVSSLEFAKRGARVILACRNRELGENEIIKRTNNKNVVFRRIDLSSNESIKEFAKIINETEDKIDILINNAGAMALGNKYNEEGLQILMQTNYFGSFLLTNLLLEKLKKSQPSRIINVASLAGYFISLNVNNLNNYSPGPTWFADIIVYCKSKLCNILFTISLAKRLKGTGVTVNVLHPGIIKTKLFRNLPRFLGNVTNLIVNIFFKSVEEGAQTTIYLATSNDVENKTGCYFSDCKEQNLYWNVNVKTAEALWKKTEEILQL